MTFPPSIEDISSNREEKRNLQEKHSHYPKSPLKRHSIDLIRNSMVIFRYGEIISRLHPTAIRNLDTAILAKIYTGIHTNEIFWKCIEIPISIEDLSYNREDLQP